MEAADRKPVIDIFNYFIENGFAAYREKKVGYDMFDRFLAMIGDFPAITIKSESGEIVGFAFFRPYHPAETFRSTAEVSYFILPEHTGQGLGSLVLGYFETEARARGITVLLASISSLNAQSIAFHRKHGFVECGRFRDIGMKRSRTFDMVWMQKKL
ncbi:MAG: N-acetyltransferase [Candidatus Zixiibacteriota bacterium]|nr:MAG: N-acetyltransferase [candidate division Zixibacteria bacterium]